MSGIPRISSRASVETQCLMETLSVEPSGSRLGVPGPRSHSSICLTARDEDDVAPLSTVSFQVEKAGHKKAVSPDDPLCGGRKDLPVPVEGHPREKSEDFSKKARWVIIVTAVVLVLMSILLVGITLRLAPVIDDLVRKENEEGIMRLRTTPSTSFHQDQRRAENGTVEPPAG